MYVCTCRRHHSPAQTPDPGLCCHSGDRSRPTPPALPESWPPTQGRARRKHHPSVDSGVRVRGTLVSPMKHVCVLAAGGGPRGHCRGWVLGSLPGSKPSPWGSHKLPSTCRKSLMARGHCTPPGSGRTWTGWVPVSYPCRLCLLLSQEAWAPPCTGRPTLATSSKRKASHASPRLPSSSLCISSYFLVFLLSHTEASFPHWERGTPHILSLLLQQRGPPCTGLIPLGTRQAGEVSAPASRVLADSRGLTSCGTFGSHFSGGPWTLPHPHTY